MALDSNFYPDAPLSTNVPAPASTTLAAEYASLEAYDNSEVEVWDIAPGGTPFYSTLTNVGRQMNGGDFKSMGLNEKNVVMSNNFPLYTFVSQDEKQEFYEVNGTINSSATALVLTSTAGIIAGDIFRVVETNEQILVTAVPNGTTLTIVRGFGTVPGAQITDEGTIHYIDNTIGAGVSGIDASGEIASPTTNVFQKIVTSINSNDFNNLSPKYGGDKAQQVQRSQKRKMIEHSRKLEKAVLFGRKKVLTGGVGHMGGIIDFAEEGWTDDISGALTRQTLEQAFSNPLRYTRDGRAEKWAFVGTEVMSVLSDLFYADQVRTENIENINLVMKTIQMNNGVVHFVQHPDMTPETGYSKHAIVTDFNYVKMVYPTGVGLDGKSFDGKTKFYYLWDQSNYSIQKGEWVTYATLEVVNLNAHGIFKIVP